MDIPIKQTTVYFAETEDLNQLLVEQFKGDNVLDDDDDYHYVAIQPDKDGNDRIEASPIAIADIEAFLEIIKSKGGTHVAIDFHGDHFTYMIEGYKMERA
jgi:hypothetical protein